MTSLPRKTRYRFLYRVGSRYLWESALPVPGDSRHGTITCDVNWFWGNQPAGTPHRSENQQKAVTP